MYKINVFKKQQKNNKFAFSIKYETKEQAENAKFVLERMPNKTYTFQPGEGRPKVSKQLGGYVVSDPTIK